MLDIWNLADGIAVLALAVAGSAPALALGKQGTIPIGKLQAPPDHEHLLTAPPQTGAATSGAMPNGMSLRPPVTRLFAATGTIRTRRR
jgi:hypothetical protein